MHELTEVRQLRAHIPAPDTDQAFAVLAGAMTGENATTALGPARRRRISYLVGAMAVTAAVAAGTVISLPLHTKTPASSSSGPAINVQPGPGGHRIARSAAELVDYATSAAANSVVSVPSPRAWMYINELDKGPHTGPNGYHSQTWQQVGFGRDATLENGKLSYGGSGGPGTQMIGWPGNVTNLYRYLATLPTQPAALRKFILANNHFKPSAAFDAVGTLMNDFPLPPWFQAELYAVLVSLPGVHFDRSATDAAGRHGIALYMIQDGFLKKEIIVNPRTYVYMGGLWIAVKAHTEYGTSPAVLRLHKGSIEGWNAIISSGIVSRAGQLP